MLSDLAWVQVGHDRYRLNLARGERARIAPTILGDWEVTLEDGSQESLLSRAHDLEDAVHDADRFVARNRADSIKLVQSHSPWRHQPASEKQLAVLRALKITLPARLTKGQASHLIGMLPSGPARMPPGEGRGADRKNATPTGSMRPRGE